MAVNVSARQLSDPMFPHLVASTVADNGVKPSQVALEFTESALIAANPVTGSVLGELTALGVRMGLDDFGTGFSSLAYLKRFPIDFLKIDRSFVAGLKEDEARDPGIGHGTGWRRYGHRDRHYRPSPQPRAESGGRRGRDPRATTNSATPEVRPGPGLPLLRTCNRR